MISTRKSRLYDFKPGTKVESAKANGEFNQLISAHNDVVTDLEAANAAVMPTVRIADGAITTLKLASQSVTPDKFAPGIWENVVYTAHRNNAVLDHPDGSVTPAKLSFLTVDRATVHLRYYIDPVNGNDTNDGLTKLTAFKTIQYAINKLPKVIDNWADIILLNGDYTSQGQILFSGFMGSGTLNMYSDTSAGNVKIASINIVQCPVNVEIDAVTVIPSGSITPINIVDSFNVNLYTVISTNDQTASNITGIAIENSNVFIDSCTINYKGTAILANALANCYVTGSSGTGNVKGCSANGGYITVTTSALSATTLYETLNGGVISIGSSNKMYAAGVELASVTGTQTLTNKTLSAPRITPAGSINDTNGATMLKFLEQVSAVNYLQLQNAPATSAPGITAVGNDPNIDLSLSAKGSGQVKAGGSPIATMGVGGAIVGSTGTLSVPMNGTVKSLTPTGACTLNASGGAQGARCSIVITSSGTVTYAVTFGTNFISSGAVNTGTVTAKTFVVDFVCTNGTQWVEVARSPAAGM